MKTIRTIIALSMICLLLITNFRDGNAIKKANKPHPCDIITVKYIKSVFNTPETLEIEKSKRGFPTCTYSWMAKSKGKMKIRGMEIEIEQTNRVLIVIPNMKADENSYEQSIKSYKDELESIDVFGDKAVWSNKRNQATVLFGNTLMHVHVKFFDGEKSNKDYAIRIIETIIDKL
jgi:hypothetical protein